MSLYRPVRWQVCFLLLSLLLMGCVQTQVPSQKKRVFDKEKALESYVTLGMAYLQRGNRDASRRNFERALEIDGRSPEAHNGMGMLFELTGETSLSEESFKRSLKENDNYTQARINYGAFLYRQKRYEEAFQQFEQGSKDLTYDQRGRALAYVGQTSLKLGDIARARSSFEHSLNVDNTSTIAMLELAQLHLDDKDYATAKRYLDQYDAIAKPSAKSLWLGIQIERIFGNKDKEASYALALKNLHPYSKEYLEYKALQDQRLEK